TDAAKDAATDTGSASDGATDAGSSNDGATDAGVSSDVATSADVLDATSSDESSAVDASDSAADSYDSPTDAGASSDVADGAAGNVVINEVNSVNPDFVEFYNTGTDPIDISGWYFSDNDPDAANHRYTFPASTIL